METSKNRSKPFWKKHRRFLGIEINDHAIYLADIQFVRDKRLYVHACLSEPLPEGTVKEGVIQNFQALVRTLKKLVTFSGTSAKKVHLALPAEQVMMQFMTLPVVSKRKFDKLLRFELEHQWRIPFEDPYYDHIKWRESPSKQLKDNELELPQPHRSVDAVHKEAAATTEQIDMYNPESKPLNDGMQYAVLLVSASRKQIKSYQDLFSAVNLKPISFEIKPLSMFRLLDYMGLAHANETVLCVDLKTSGVDYSIFKGPVMKLSRNVPLEIDDFSNSAAVASALELELSRLLNFYRYNLNHRDENVARIYLSGEGQRLPDIAEALSARLSIPTRHLVPEKMKFADLQLEASFPRFAAVIGLALRGDRK